MASIAACRTSKSTAAAVSLTARAAAWVIFATTSASRSVAVMSPRYGCPITMIGFLELCGTRQRDAHFGIPGEPDGPTKTKHCGLRGLALPRNCGDRTLGDASRVSQHSLRHPLLSWSKVGQYSAHPDEHRYRSARVRASSPPRCAHSVCRLSPKSLRRAYLRPIVRGTLTSRFATQERP